MSSGDFSTGLLAAQQTPVPEHQQAKLQQAMEFIQAHFTEHIGLKAVAAVTGLRIYHFHRLFHLHFRKTLKHAITECQIELAKQLLVEGVKTVEVANVKLQAVHRFDAGEVAQGTIEERRRARGDLHRQRRTFHKANRWMLKEAARLRDVADQLIDHAKEIVKHARPGSEFPRTRLDRDARPSLPFRPAA
jgi:AraC-like DNA-binding protein